MVQTEPSIRVLIADDHTRMRENLRKLIGRQADMEVIGEAGDGRTALAMAEGLHPDVLLLDIQMPGLDGIEVARSLLEVDSPVHILILSAYVDAHFIRAAKDLQVSGYLSKEEAPLELIDSIRCVAHGATNCYSRLAVQAMARGNFSQL